MTAQQASSTRRRWPKPLVTTHDPKRLRRAGYHYDRATADLAVEFFRRFLSHVKGEWAGRPLELAAWQEQEIIRPLFGWRRPDGTRLYREAYIRVPRKNGKSTLAAGIAGFLLYADREPGAEVYSAAVDRDQAAIVFDALAEMVRGNPVLSERSEVYRRSVVVTKTRSSYKVLSADVGTKHGLNASGVVVDELHAHPSRNLFDVLSTSTGSRRQPLVVSITTAGVWSPDSICVEKDDYTRKVADQVMSDDAFLGVIYAAEPGDDWRKPTTWRKANPNLGVSLSREYLARECAKAEASVAAQNTFRTAHLNQWVQQITRWIDLGSWDASAGSVIEPDLGRRTVYAGLDLASTSDLTAWLLAFPNGPWVYDEDGEVLERPCGTHVEGGCISFLARHFCPEAALERGRNADLYRAWARGGHLQVTPGNATDYAFVREQVLTDAGRWYVAGLNIDFLFQGGQLAGELLEEGLPVQAFRQGFLSYGLPMKEFERLLLEGKLHHGGNPVLRWMADNVVVRQDPAGNLKPDKERSADKIDGIVAMVMALDLVIREGWNAADPQVAVF